MSIEKEKFDLLNKIEAYQTRIDMLNERVKEYKHTVNDLTAKKNDKKKKVAACKFGKGATLVLIGAMISGAIIGMPLVLAGVLGVSSLVGFVVLSHAKLAYQAMQDDIQKQMNEPIARIDAIDKETSKMNMLIQATQTQLNNLKKQEKEMCNKQQIKTVQAIKGTTPKTPNSTDLQK